jgi:hypothetical protein
VNGRKGNLVLSNDSFQWSPLVVTALRIVAVTRGAMKAIGEYVT